MLGKADEPFPYIPAKGTVPALMAPAPDTATLFQGRKLTTSPGRHDRVVPVGDGVAAAKGDPLPRRRGSQIPM